MDVVDDQLQTRKANTTIQQGDSASKATTVNSQKATNDKEANFQTRYYLDRDKQHHVTQT